MRAGEDRRALFKKTEKNGGNFDRTHSPPVAGPSNSAALKIGAVAQFERSLIRERQREGIEVAKKRGAYKGRKKALCPASITVLKAVGQLEKA